MRRIENKKRNVNVEIVKKWRDEPIERMLKRFSKKVKREGILEDYKERMQYKKPSVARHAKKRRCKHLQDIGAWN
jgi:ribosomal protein S21